jgi:serine/threonine-protein kinase HipA
MLPDKIKRLLVSIGDMQAGSLVREGPYIFTYDQDDPDQPLVSLLMPPNRISYSDGDLFPSMDMNLPEGFLFQRIMELHPKRQLTKMHFLALSGRNGIGRVGFSLPAASAPPVSSTPTISRQSILHSTAGSALFEQLLDAYLSTGAGISGVQPKVMVPSTEKARASIAIPDLIIKTEGPEYPGLSGNEFMCLTAAAAAGINTPTFDLSADGSILVIDRFDIAEDGQRLGFEDIAALKGLPVLDRLSTRKYEGSYEDVACVIGLLLSSPDDSLHRFFEQLAFSVMVRNGDAHLKNFGLLYDTSDDAQLAPMFDVVTTAIYEYERASGVLDVDRTLALKLNKSNAYPTTKELVDFGKVHCRVSSPQAVIERIAEGMSQTLVKTSQDDRISGELRQKMTQAWEAGFAYASSQK